MKKPRLIIICISLLSIILILLIIGNQAKPRLYNKPLKIIIPRDIINKINIYNYKNSLIIFDGWEIILDYKKQERVLGTNYQENNLEFNNEQYLIQNSENQINLVKEIVSKGFFNKETAKKETEEYKEDKNRVTKIYWYNQKKNPSKIGYIFTVPKTLFSTRPYFKIQLFAEANNPEQLKEAGYGMVIRGYNLHLPNGNILKNDYKRIETTEQKDIYIDGIKQDPTRPEFQDIMENKVILEGTNHKIENIPYQIFYNQEKAIIIWGEFDYIDNLFKWEVFRPFFTKKESENTFKPLYIAILNKATLEYKNNTYIINSKEFNGDVNTLIKDWTF